MSEVVIKTRLPLLKAISTLVIVLAHSAFISIVVEILSFTDVTDHVVVGRVVMRLTIHRTRDF